MSICWNSDDHSIQRCNVQTTCCTYFLKTWWKSLLSQKKINGKVLSQYLNVCYDLIQKSKFRINYASFKIIDCSQSSVCSITFLQQIAPTQRILSERVEGFPLIVIHDPWYHGPMADLTLNFFEIKFIEFEPVTKFRHFS